MGSVLPVTRDLWSPKPKDSQVQTRAGPHRPPVWPSGLLGPVPTSPTRPRQDQSHVLFGDQASPGRPLPWPGQLRASLDDPALTPAPLSHQLPVSQREWVCVWGVTIPEGRGWGWRWGRRGAPFVTAPSICSRRDVLLLRRAVPAVGALPPRPLLHRGCSVCHPPQTQGEWCLNPPRATACDGATELAGVPLGPRVLTPGLQRPEGRTLPASCPQGLAQGPVTAYFCHFKMCTFLRFRSLKKAAAHPPQNLAVVMAVIFFFLNHLPFSR